jgi:hypothetical protein
MIHNNWNLLYVLRWCWNNDLNWCQTWWLWLLIINLENNDATFWWNIYMWTTASSTIWMRDDESPNWIKYIHANSNNIWFLNWSWAWISRWDHAWNQVTTWWWSFWWLVTATTPATSDNSINVATTAFVKNQWYVTSSSSPVTSVSGKVWAVTLVKWDVWLWNVDNTSDVNKPVSTATQTALNSKMSVDTQTRDNAWLRWDAWATNWFFQTASPINYPAWASSWWHLIDTRHSNTANNFALQIAWSFFDQNLYFRKTNDSPTTWWSKVVAENSSWNVWIWTSPSEKLDVEWTIRSNYVAMDPQDGTNEWWEIQLKWAWIFWNVQIDNFQWNLRIHTLASWKLFQVLWWWASFWWLVTATTPATSDNSTNLATTAYVKNQWYVTSSSSPVTSVSGKVWAVTLVTWDVWLWNVDNTADSVKNVLSATSLTTARTINGTSFNWTANVSINSTSAQITDATSANTANMIVKRDWNWDFNWRYINSDYLNMSHWAWARNTDTVFYSSYDNYIRKNTLVWFLTSLWLNNVNNTSDANKPVSTAQQTALNLKANLASPWLTGTPTAPTPGVWDNSTTIATTAYVKNQWYITSASETDPQVWANTTNYIPKWNWSSLVSWLLFDNATNVWVWTVTPNRRLDVAWTINASDWITLWQDADNSNTIQTYIDWHWLDRASYAWGCCNNLKIQPDVWTVQVWSATNTQWMTLFWNLNMWNLWRWLVWIYDSFKYQWVFSMWPAYQLATDWTSPWNLYWLAWTHTNVWWESKAWLSHQLLIMLNWVTQTALWSGIWTNWNVISLWNTIINNASPTTIYQDTDHRSAMVYVNSNLLYVLRWCWNNSLSWCQTWAWWPLTINLENNDANFWWNITLWNTAMTYLTLRDDDSPNGVKYIHANGNLVWWLSWWWSWLSYWDNAWYQVNSWWASFWWNVTASTPTAASHLATKGYVDSAVASAAWWGPRTCFYSFSSQADCLSKTNRVWTPVIEADWGVYTAVHYFTCQPTWFVAYSNSNWWVYANLDNWAYSWMRQQTWLNWVYHSWWGICW